jgi:trimethylamine corrinoid protein
LAFSKNEILDKLRKAILDGDEDTARKVAEEVVAAKIDLLRVIEEGIGKPMQELGDLFQAGEIFLPNLMLAADATGAAFEVIKKSFTPEMREKVRVGTVVIGTSYGDIHSIGKSILSALLSAAGFEVHDLGVSVPVQTFVDKAKEVNADIIAVSTLLTPSRSYQRDLINYLTSEGTRNNFYIIIGGAATDPTWTKQIGADGFARHAHGGVKICKSLTTERPSPPLDEPCIED